MNPKNNTLGWHISEPPLRSGVPVLGQSQRHMHFFTLCPIMYSQYSMGRRLTIRIPAAFAPVSGAFYTANTTSNTCDPETIPYNPDINPARNCTPGRLSIPMLEFHGLADKTISYTGGVRRKACLPTIPHWIQTWAVRDGLGSTNISSTVPGALEGSAAVRYEFGEGSDQGLVTHIADGTVSSTMFFGRDKNGR